MNYLDLCKRVNDLVGFQGVVTSTDTTGYQKVLTGSVRDAWEDIQRYRQEWDFMRGHRQVNVGPTANYYTLDTLWGVDSEDLSQWLHVNYDKDRLIQLSYDTYESMDFGEESYKPQYYAIDPVTKGLHISPVDAVYTLDVYYIRELQTLVNNSDIPVLPERFHMAIVYGAVVKLSTFVGNATLYDMYSLKYGEIMGQLMREENPPKFIRKRPVA